MSLVSPALGLQELVQVGNLFSLLDRLDRLDQRLFDDAEGDELAKIRLELRRVQHRILQQLLQKENGTVAAAHHAHDLQDPHLLRCTALQGDSDIVHDARGDVAEEALRDPGILQSPCRLLRELELLVEALHGSAELLAVSRRRQVLGVLGRVTGVALRVAIYGRRGDVANRVGPHLVRSQGDGLVEVQVLQEDTFTFHFGVIPLKLGGELVHVAVVEVILYFNFSLYRASDDLCLGLLFGLELQLLSSVHYALSGRLRDHGSSQLLLSKLGRQRLQGLCRTGFCLPLC
mmetsp:Transcript_21383/g.40197  ORF Transcript_21383/g.40197 Transcript_21383/m.40197 type:complete len:289 (-) Transcript_21383:1379-2245(-)